MLRLSLMSLSALVAIAACETAPTYKSNEELGVVSVTPFAETPAVESSEDAADDPAIWWNPSNPEKSLVLGTNKQSGIYVYDLKGNQTQYLPVGNVNNVDVRSVLADSGVRHIAAASNRTSNSITLMEIEELTGTVKVIGDIPVSEPEVYGYCLGLSKDNNTLLSFVNTKTAKVIVHKIDINTMGIEEAGVWTFGGQMEGCANDDPAGVLFLGEEEYGFWKVTHDNGVEVKRESIDTIANDDGLVMDVEGIDIYKGKDGAGYVIVSAQAADRYVVYDRKAPHAKIGIFNIKDNADRTVDGVSHTDGLAVISTPLGADLPKGLFVVQDDANTLPNDNQNFKYVDWRDIATALELED